MDPLVIAGALLIAIVSSLVTAQFALWRFRKSNWWERKAQAYEDVISALADLALVLGAYWEEVQGTTTMSSEEQAKAEDTTSSAITKVQLTAYTGGFLISKKAKKRLEEYIKDARHEDREAGWHMVILDHNQAIKRCLTDMIELAREDLGITD